MPSKMESIDLASEVDESHRRFLIAAATVIGAGVTGLFSAVLVDNMNPGKAISAMGAPVDLDVSKLDPSQLIIVEWKKKPVWIVRRGGTATLVWLAVFESLVWLIDYWMYATQAHGWALMLRTVWIPSIYVAVVLLSALLRPGLTADAPRLPEQLTAGGLFH